jgi:hypothetical protein
LRFSFFRLLVICKETLFSKRVREGPLLEKNMPMSTLSERCPTTKQKGKEHEQIQKAIAYDLALRASHRAGAKISLPGDGWEDKRGSGIRPV